MQAIGRALMAFPKLIVLDEPSLGLAPLLVPQIRDIIVDINEQGTSVLLIEQNAQMALSIATTGYIMETGKVVMDGPAAKLLKDEDVMEFYLGLHGDGDGDGDRRSSRDIKHYKRDGCGDRPHGYERPDSRSCRRRPCLGKQKPRPERGARRKHSGRRARQVGSASDEPGPRREEEAQRTTSPPMSAAREAPATSRTRHEEEAQRTTSPRRH